MAPRSYPTLEQEIVRFTVAQLCVVTNAPAVNSGSRVGLTRDLMDRGLVICTVTDAHGAAVRVSRSICSEWGLSVLTEELQ